MGHRFRVPLGDAICEVEVAGDGVVTVDDQTFTVEPLPDGRFLVTDAQGARQVVLAAGELRTPWVAHDGVAAELSLQRPTGGTTPTSATVSDLTSPMPATVVSIAAPAGTAVEAGDPVVVVEAMKMTLTIRAPRAGVVRAIRCQVGELVKAGTPLAELEP